MAPFEQLNDFEKMFLERFSASPWDSKGNTAGFNRGGGLLGYDAICAHIPLLSFLARYCNHCTEFGVQNGGSTVALVSKCKGKVVSYDLYESDFSKKFRDVQKPCEWEFHIQNTFLDFEIEQTDLLFIDTVHTYRHLKKELRHHTKVNRYIALHDTFTQWTKSWDNEGEEGIGRAIYEFLSENPEWEVVYNALYNHGLMVLEKTHVH